MSRFITRSAAFLLAVTVMATSFATLTAIPAAHDAAPAYLA